VTNRPSHRERRLAGREDASDGGSGVSPVARPAVDADRWADDEYRSLNAHVEMLLRDALTEAGRMPKKAGPLPRRGRPPAAAD
jgi:hypothetical protein